MCDVPSIAVFCSESIECFPGIVSKFFVKLLVTIPVAPIITGTIVHFRFNIRCISIHKLLCFNFFSASFAQHFCLRVLPHLSVCMFSLVYYYYYYYYKCVPVHAVKIWRGTSGTAAQLSRQLHNTAALPPVPTEQDEEFPSQLLDVLKKRKIFCSCRDSIPRTSSS